MGLGRVGCLGGEGKKAEEKIGAQVGGLPLLFLDFANVEEKKEEREREVIVL